MDIEKRKLSLGDGKKLSRKCSNGEVKIPIKSLKDTPQFYMIEKHLDELDKDGDGTIDATELSVFLEKHNSIVSSLKKMKCAIALMVIMVILMGAINFGLTYVAINLMKQVKTEKSDEGTSGMVNSDGDLLHIARGYDESTTYSAEEFFEMDANDYLLIQKLIFRDVGYSSALRYEIANVQITDNAISLSTKNGHDLIFQDGTLPLGAEEVEIYTSSEFEE
mmetsp:Transcript_38739/g.51049  ORF Transcript_38739/g.51049 Transcript_38739/m.51049 type:complete len:221 (-) Transcript_38739:87-749(-)|eukprot:CAMPEP_0117762160 /NCGR_PEP_ID=MMETSP0947-20121206/17758_1 /TAXON_ID=44440 /ORGANISM="Chattonella subsalsa, Strain CCMP2191" /LENGTH=220 /DNA_ID=CAMNT_0005583385 /DNA_START=87 /DNA_END=749 /DNA_ORIENTATION=-